MMLPLLLLACAQPPPAVVVVVTDAMRADLGGADPPHWTDGSRRYTRAYSASPWTTSSTATLVTGRYPLGQERQPPTQHPSRCWSLDQGAPTTYPWPAEAWPDEVVTDHWVVARLAGKVPSTYAGPTESEVWDDAHAALADGHRAVYVHALAAHEPLGGLPDGWARTTPDRLASVLAGCGTGLPDDLAGWVRWQHRASVEHVLVEVDHLIRAAREAGAVVIWTADHGEALGDGGRWWHGQSLDDEQVRVPLLVWGPGVVPGVDDTPIPATCVAATARIVMGDQPEGCDLRAGDVRGVVEVGMLQGGEWVTRRPGTDTTTEED